MPEFQVQKVLKIAKEAGIGAYHAGEVKDGEKEVIIEPLNIIFAADTLQVRV